MSQAKSVLPKIFKGIALFTPGGDLIYCIDPAKQKRWHLHLCAGLQEILQLPEPPHFLVPCYTATVECWLNPRTQQVQTFAEAHPLVLRHQALLNTVFEMGELVWQAAPWSEGSCEPMVIATYRSLFPQLWEDHDLIVRFERLATKPQPGLMHPSNEKAMLETGLSYSSLLGTHPSKERHHHSDTATTFKKTLASTLDEHQQPETLSYVFRLFVAGNTAGTERILKTLKKLLDESLTHPYTLKVVDVFKHPARAEADQVLATPTLVKVSPPPIRRLVGNLDNVEKILHVLGSLED